jgi:hypothetical protein
MWTPATCGRMAEFEKKKKRRALLANLALNADQGGQHERQRELSDLKPALAGKFANLMGRL